MQRFLGVSMGGDWKGFRVSMMLEWFLTLSEDDDVHWCFDGYGSGCFCR